MMKNKIIEGLRWRKNNLERHILRSLGYRDIQWLRYVMQCESEAFIASLPVREMTVLEISGRNWRRQQFRSYTSKDYPEYDVCAGVLNTADRQFDLVVAEQVFEHVTKPFAAARNVYAMLKPGGWFMVNAPFLVRVHRYPTDCWRWTEEGMRNMLVECGFETQRVRTGSWGNRACARANLTTNEWAPWKPWNSLVNEPDFPLVVWAFAQK